MVLERLLTDYLRKGQEFRILPLEAPTPDGHPVISVIPVYRTPEDDKQPLRVIVPNDTEIPVIEGEIVDEGQAFMVIGNSTYPFDFCIDYDEDDSENSEFPFEVA